MNDTSAEKKQQTIFLSLSRKDSGRNPRMFLQKTIRMESGLRCLADSAEENQKKTYMLIARRQN